VEIKEFPQAKEATDVKVQDQTMLSVFSISGVSSTFNLYLIGPLLIILCGVEKAY
jgi:hypothetical protein